MADQPASAIALRAIAYARSQIGTPYSTTGAETPRVGFDCSSLCQWAYGQAGKSIPRTSETQWAAGYPKVPWGKWAPGDLIFSDYGDGQPAPGHVVIYVGDGWTIAAPHSGLTVEYEPASTFAPASGHYIGSSRPAPLRGTAPPQTGVGKIGAGATPIPGGNVTQPGGDSSGGGAADSSSSDLNTGAAALGGGGLLLAGVLVLALGVVTFFYLRRRSNAAPPGTPPAAAEGGSP